jgi:hypothetical protein
VKNKIQLNSCIEHLNVPLFCLQAEDPKEAAKGILARAAARGIIAGVPELAEAKKEPEIRQIKKKKAKKDVKIKEKTSKSQRSTKKSGRSHVRYYSKITAKFLWKKIQADSSSFII